MHGKVLGAGAVVDPGLREGQHGNDQARQREENAQGHPARTRAQEGKHQGALGPIETSICVTFEEKAGRVAVTIEERGRHLWCELAAPEAFSLGQTLAARTLAPVLSLQPDDIVTDAHLPQVASVGLPFLFVELKDRKSLERARAVVDGLDDLARAGVTPDVHLYVHSADEFDCDRRS